MSSTSRCRRVWSSERSSTGAKATATARRPGPGTSLNAPYSSVTLVSLAGVVQGSIRTLDGAYSLEPAGPGVHVIRQVDPRLLPPELEPLAAPADAMDPTTDNPPIAGDDASTIDVLVLYTPGARTSAGGSDATVQARIALGVSETNTGYGNSGVTPRLRLVGTQLWNYVESGSISTDLSTFRGDSGVAALRNTLGADMVGLIVANTPEACGVGYLMTTLSSGFAANAYSVTAYHASARTTRSRTSSATTWARRTPRRTVASACTRIPSATSTPRTCSAL